MKHPNAKYGLSGSKNGRISGILSQSQVASCHDYCHASYNPFSQRDQMIACKENCDAMGQQPTPSPDAGNGNGNSGGAGNGNGNGANGADTQAKGDLTRNIVIGFSGLMLLLLLIWLFVRK